MWLHTPRMAVSLLPWVTMAPWLCFQHGGKIPRSQEAIPASERGTEHGDTALSLSLSLPQGPSPALCMLSSPFWNFPRNLFLPRP